MLCSKIQLQSAALPAYICSCPSFTLTLKADFLFCSVKKKKKKSVHFLFDFFAPLVLQHILCTQVTLCAKA